MLKLKLILLALILSVSITPAQDENGGIEIFLIDAYVRAEIPHTFVLSFYTDIPAKTKVILDKNYTYDVSTESSELHNAKILLTDLQFNNKIVNFVIHSEDSLGNEYESEVFDFDLPFEPDIKSGSNLFTFCLFGGMIFGLPAPGYVRFDGGNYVSLTKEIPLLSFRSKSYKYPAGYLSAEYTHIFNAPEKNFLRFGYKRFIEVKFIKYISPGITGYTNFLGHNGISPEISFGLFNILNDAFTVYTRYRFSIKPVEKLQGFHEINLGLYSSFFSFYLK